VDLFLGQFTPLPGPIAGAGLPRPDLRERRSSRLVAAAAEHSTKANDVSSKLKKIVRSQTSFCGVNQRNYVEPG